MKSTCWDTRATDSITKSGQKDTEASIHVMLKFNRHSQVSVINPKLQVRDSMSSFDNSPSKKKLFLSEV